MIRARFAGGSALRSYQARLGAAACSVVLVSAPAPAERPAVCIDGVDAFAQLLSGLSQLAAPAGDDGEAADTGAPAPATPGRSA